MNAIDLLLRDHRRIRRLLRDLVEARDADLRGEIFGLAEEALQVHSALEEDLFYPAVRRAAGTDAAEELYIKSRDEHKLADTIVPHLRFVNRRSNAFNAKARLARELIEQHIENEYRELFPLAEAVLTPRELDDLGARMERSGRLLHGKPILAAQSRMFDCDRDGLRFASPFFTVISSVGC